jgi:EAL domain-containing protein (putative c-di-GMP-specific phosphodiesterase class I)
MCCRLGNDEFILAELAEEANHKQIHAVRRRIDEMLEQHNRETTDGYQLQIFSGSRTSRVWTLSEMEDLVNAAVSRKNGNKASEQKMHNNSKLTAAEQESAEVVKKILNENLFTYHFQPIVSAKDGSIVAYEALMRAQIEPSVSPLDIIKYATHLDRLYDVERATFFNIMKLVEDKESEFSGKKVFINSIPGSQLDGEDGDALSQALQKHGEHVVVELTEQTEADDKVLAEMKEKFSQMGVETAVDDYGTGYSNIVNLLRYMPNYVKVDRMLLSGIQDNPQKQHFVKDIVSFAHENHFQVLAEGVETTEELETVIRLDVDLIQGYYTARPNPEVLPQIASEIQDEILRYNDEQRA